MASTSADALPSRHPAGAPAEPIPNPLAPWPRIRERSAQCRLERKGRNFWLTNCIARTSARGVRSQCQQRYVRRWRQQLNLAKRSDASGRGCSNASPTPCTPSVKADAEARPGSRLHRVRLPLLPACGAPHPCCRTSGWGLRAGRSECQGLLYPKYQYPTLLSGSGSSVHITPTSEIDQRPRITYSYGLRPTTLYVYLS